MGLIKAFGGALSSSFKDQWLEFLSIPEVTATTVFAKALPNNVNGKDNKGSINIISNGSKILVPEGFGLITMENGMITSVTTEPGGYIWNSEDKNSKSVFDKDGILSSTFGLSFERFKYAGNPSANQQAFFFNMKEIPNNKFGTTNPIYFMDGYLGTQVGVICRGRYTIKVLDPVLLVKQLVPVEFIQSNEIAYDLADYENPTNQQLFTEIVGSLLPAFSEFSQSYQGIMGIQSKSFEFSNILANKVYENYGWDTRFGIKVERVSIESLNYDEKTSELLAKVQNADAMGRNSRSNVYTQMSIAEGIKSAGENGGGEGLAFLGMGANMLGGMGMANLQTNQQSPMDTLKQYKQMLDEELITEEEYNQVKKKILGI